MPLEVTIVADQWPQETTWAATDAESGEEVAAGSNDGLVPGEPVKFLECINDKRGCYEFTIYDTGGDGVCCDHGQGSYAVKYDGVELKRGSAFYEYEMTPFGLCGKTEEPQSEPTQAPKASKPSGGTIGSGGGSAGDSAYRCVAAPLVESGYVVATDKCGLFVNCYNPQIKVGDDWFCHETSQCIEAPACSAKEETSDNDTPNSSADSVSFRCVADRLVESGYVVSGDKCGESIVTTATIIINR